MECAKARNHVAQARKVESNEERAQRLQVQAMRAIEFIATTRAIDFLSKQMKGCKLKKSIKLPMWQL
jgi:hypothetical protein